MLSSAAVAMQSIFQLPWTCDPAREKQPKLDDARHFQSSRVKPALDLTFIASTKRKRTDSLNSLPKGVNTPQQKRPKVALHGGAVQPPFELARERRAFTAGEGDAVVATAPVKGADAPAAEAENVSRATAALVQQQSAARLSEKPRPARDENSTQAQMQPGSGSGKPALQGDRPSTEASAAVSEGSLDHVRSIVAAHIDLEILLKHNELRLIEQELAKCQVALEQIRRCELIPFPGATGMSSDVSSGSGAALRSPHGYTTPRHPAAFGVTDGPYTRHYAQWLLPDAAFDPHVAFPAVTSAGGFSATSRTARAYAADLHLPPTPIGRGSRTSGGSKSHMLAQDASQPHRDPLLMKREMDGQWVRLVCTKCKPERANFQNIQGFLNHCRISHQDNYKSHEQAAIACGRPVEVEESTMAPPGTSQSNTKSRSSVPSTPLDTFSTLKSSATCVVDKSLEKNTAPLSSLAAGSPAQGGQEALRKLVLPRALDPVSTPLVCTPTTELPESEFAASPQTPYLGEFLKRRKFSGDLLATVIETKSVVDTSVYDCSDSEVELGVHSKSGKQKNANNDALASKRLQANTGRKAAECPPKTQRQPHGSSMAATQFSTEDKEICKAHRVQHQTPLRSISDSADDDMELSPGNTMDSNPGLVSDHEGESDDGDEDVVADPTSSSTFTKNSSVIARRDTNDMRSRPFAAGHGDLMDIDDYVEIQDASDAEREPAGVRVGERPGVEVTCSSRTGSSN